jgi:hypothetical protein
MARMLPCNDKHSSPQLECFPREGRIKKIPRDALGGLNLTDDVGSRDWLREGYFRSRERF